MSYELAALIDPRDQWAASSSYQLFPSALAREEERSPFHLPGIAKAEIPWQEHWGGVGWGEPGLDNKGFSSYLSCIRGRGMSWDPAMAIVTLTSSSSPLSLAQCRKPSLPGLTSSVLGCLKLTAARSPFEEGE